MRNRLGTAAVLVALSLAAFAAGDAVAGGSTGLTPETIEKLEESFVVAAETKALMNAGLKNGKSPWMT